MAVAKDAKDAEPANAKRAGNTASVIYTSLRNDILSGKIPDGALLSQLTIARDFGTSRGPVREALQRLQQEQIIVARANQRYYIPPFSIADFEGLLCLKLLNMSVAIRVCVPLLAPEQVEQIGEAVSAMNTTTRKTGAASETAREDRWEKSYRRFSTTIVAPAGARTGSLITDLLDNLQRYRSNTASRMTHRLRLDEIELAGVVDACRDGDGHLAARCYADYFYRISVLIIAGVDPRWEPSLLRGTMNALFGDAGEAGKKPASRAARPAKAGTAGRQG